MKRFVLVEIDEESATIAVYVMGLLAAMFAVYTRNVSFHAHILFLAKEQTRDLLLLVLSGALLLLHYFSFYRALRFGPAIDVYIIGYLWPVLAVVFVHIFNRGRWTATSLRDWALVSVAFLGAITIWVGSIPLSIESAGARMEPYTFALLSAIFGGAYWPFLLRAIDRLEEHSATSLHAVITAVSFITAVGVAMAAIIVVALFPLLGFDWSFSSAISEMRDSSLSTWSSLFYVGAFVFFVCEVFWASSILSYQRPTVATIAYLTPVFSVLFLRFWADQQLSQYAVLGVVLVMAANYLLHMRPGPTNATIGAFLASVLLGVGCFLHPGIDYAPGEAGTIGLPLAALRILGVVSVLFSIIVGFSMARALERHRVRRTLLAEMGANLAAIVANGRNGNRATEAADRFMRQLIDYELRTDGESTRTPDAMQRAFESLSNAALAGLDNTEREPVSQLLTRLEIGLNTWIIRILERIPYGELIAIWSLGFVMVATTFLYRATGPWHDIYSVIVGSAVTYLLIRILDLEKGRADRDLTSIFSVQNLFLRINRERYLPSAATDHYYVSNALAGTKFRYPGEDNKLETEELEATDTLKQRWSYIALSVAAAVVIAALVWRGLGLTMTF